MSDSEKIARIAEDVEQFRQLTDPTVVKLCEYVDWLSAKLQIVRAAWADASTKLILQNQSLSLRARNEADYLPYGEDDDM